MAVLLPEPAGPTNRSENGGCNKSGWRLADGRNWLSNAFTESTSFGVSSIFMCGISMCYSQKNLLHHRTLPKWSRS